MSLPDFEVILRIAGAIIALGVIGGTVRKGARAWRRVTDFFDDWEGTGERPGVPARPGVMQRLAAIEAEVQLNHGGSLKDAVHRTEQRVCEIGERLDEHIAANTPKES